MNNRAVYDLLVEEWKHIEAYKKAWSVAPYAPTFVTSDAVVVQSGHVLVVRRKHTPGKGLLALPGGFVNQDERVKDAAIRELMEETKIAVPEKVLNGSIVTSEVFDEPGRSLRGRTITHAFLFKLNDVASLPRVKGSDDAEKAFWMPIHDALAQPNLWFEDHLEIIRTMIAKIPQS